MKTILALVDFSDVTARVLQYAESFANTFGSNVVLGHIIPPEPVVVDFAPPTPPDDSAAAKSKLEALRDGLASRGIAVSTYSVQGPVVATIHDWNRQHNPDFIIMGSHGHGALYNLLVGSVTAAVLKSAPCPVLVVPSLLKAS
ncbi:MAG TPA: universal stress protein [Prosthecobacter sp.]|nr:universal stress protein [Prosthecobacter sp.]